MIKQINKPIKILFVYLSSNFFKYYFIEHCVNFNFTLNRMFACGMGVGGKICYTNLHFNFSHSHAEKLKFFIIVTKISWRL